MGVAHELRAGGSQGSPSIVQKFVLFFISKPGPKSSPRQPQCPNPKVAPRFSGSDSPGASHDPDPCQEQSSPSCKNWKSDKEYYRYDSNKDKMIDFFETLFIWGLYVILPMVLLTHFLGRYKATLLFSVVFGLYDTSELNSISFPAQIESQTPIEQIRDRGESGSFIDRWWGNSGPKNPNSKPEKPRVAPKPRPDRGPRYGVPDGGGGNGNLPDNDENQIPRSEAWQYDPDYWTDYRYCEDGRWTKKSDKDTDDCDTTDQEQKKISIKDLESSSGKYILGITNKTTRKALKRVLKNVNTQKEVIESLKKIDNGTILPRSTKDFKNFKGLREFKFSKTRMLYEPGKNGEPPIIVAIFDRGEMDAIEKALRPYYKGK